MREDLSASTDLGQDCLSRSMRTHCTWIWKLWPRGWQGRASEHLGEGLRPLAAKPGVEEVLRRLQFELSAPKIFSGSDAHEE